MPKVDTNFDFILIEKLFCKEYFFSNVRHYQEGLLQIKNKNMNWNRNGNRKTTSMWSYVIKMKQSDTRDHKI